MKNLTSPRSFKLADYLGISSATICLLHCLATPILVSMGVHVHAHEGHDHGWTLLLSHGWDFLFLGIGFLAVYWSSRHTFHPGRKALLWASFAFLAGAILLEHWGPMFQYLTYLASGLLIFAHIRNLRALVSGKQVVCTSGACRE